MADYFSTLLFWHWWVLGLALAVVEMVAPGFFLLWIGLAAGATGVILLILPGLSWQIQFLIFGVLAIGSVVAARSYFRRNPIVTEDATINRRGSQYVGRVFNLDEAIVNGVGKVKVGDGWWRAEGPDLPAGERVKVVGVDGNMLKVEKA
jgi:hypothetical protein